MSTLAISPEQARMLHAILDRCIPDATVWAYGSRVTGTARPNSDLDLVAFTGPTQAAQLSELREELSESNLPFIVDLHVWDEIPRHFQDNIRKAYIVLQQACQDGATRAK
jgi:predicted nucleotidyltransferase